MFNINEKILLPTLHDVSHGDSSEVLAICVSVIVYVYLNK